MPEAFVPLTDFVNESKSTPRDHPLDKPVAKWVEEEVLEIIKLNSELEKFLKDQTIKKSIFIPNRLINIIL